MAELFQVLAIINSLGLGGILAWVISVERRLTRILTLCEERNGDCHT